MRRGECQRRLRVGGRYRAAAGIDRSPQLREVDPGGVGEQHEGQVTSATRWIELASTSTVSGPKSGFPRRYPATAKTNGPVTSWRAKAPETTAHPSTRRAITATVDSVIPSTRSTQFATMLIAKGIQSPTMVVVMMMTTNLERDQGHQGPDDKANPHRDPEADAAAASPHHRHQHGSQCRIANQCVLLIPDTASHPRYGSAFGVVLATDVAAAPQPSAPAGHPTFDSRGPKRPVRIGGAGLRRT